MLKYGKKAVRLFASTIAAMMIFASFAYASEAKTLIPLGIVTGIKINTDGLIIAGLSQVETAEGKANPAKDAGLREGDIIEKVNGAEIGSIDDLKNAVKNASDSAELEIRRDNKTMSLNIKLCIDKNGEKKMGIWVRDSMMGIGTLTYYDPETGEYGCLGHGINDSAGNPVPITDGNLIGISLSGINRGTKDVTGELKGDFSGEELGTVVLNTHGGIFGELYAEPAGKETEICGEAKLGEAQILSAVSGSVKAYDIRIRAVYRGDDGSGKDMLIEVTDDELIELTGGIVRGMSGSPIIQNSKIIGAVTHVLVSDPRRGYGIGIDKMLSYGENNPDAAA